MSKNNTKDCEQFIVNDDEEIEEVNEKDNLNTDNSVDESTEDSTNLNGDTASQKEKLKTWRNFILNLLRDLFVSQ